MSIAAAAEAADVNPRTVRRWLAKGLIAGYRVGPRLIKVDMTELERIMEPIGGGA
ncbi:helix-turn-helix domain-containing protein [Mycolicibacter senuensis]|uniref:helix-turn-helix domain-containing protein n=1 Tax=Mycolicibacter senuensis TaxID=386913 RepID=UPI00197C4B51|nr:helix-turn-helix domain-containing protein [Mycolicibacter senuensis]